MNTETVDLSKLNTEELQAELARRNEVTKAQKDADRKAYETMKEDFIVSSCINALLLHGKLQEFKIHTFDGAQAIYKMLQEYSSRHADGKGSFRIESGNYRVTYKRQGKPTFDERADQAEKHILEFLNTRYAGDADTRELILTFLERKNGKLDIELIQKLYKMEDRFDDVNWKRGIELLKESYQYTHSKDYIGFEIKDDKGQWNAINLQFSNI